MIFLPNHHKILDAHSMNDNHLIFLSFAGKNYESLCGQGDDELPIKVLDNERSHITLQIFDSILNYDLNIAF